MLKRDLRFQYTSLRNSISGPSLLNSSLCIANRALKLPIWHLAYFHLFLPIVEKNEVDTTFILSILQGKNKNIVLPKISEDGYLKHYLLTASTQLQKNKWNIPEPIGGIEVTPDKMDVVFMPLLTFDKKGNRVGYGKGYYDRFLAQCRSDVKKIGLSLFDAADAITDCNEDDIAMDYCVTPKKIYSFSSD